MIQFLREELREGQGPRIVPGNGADVMGDCQGLGEGRSRRINRLS